MTLPELIDGDVSFSTSFVLRGITGASSATFKSPRGEKFAVLLLGTVKNDAADYDPIAALKKLGFVRADAAIASNGAGREG